jgi:hypothetical protein
MPLPTEICIAVAKNCQALVTAMRRHFRVQEERTEFEDERDVWERERGISGAVSRTLCQFGRYLRHVRERAHLLGDVEEELLSVESYFLLMLEHYDLNHGPSRLHSMDDWIAWHNHYLADRDLSDTAPHLLDGLVDAGQRLEQKARARQDGDKVRHLHAQERHANCTPVQTGRAAERSRLLFDQETFFITLDGTSYGPLPPPGFHFFKVLHDAKGDRLKAAQIRKKMPDGWQINEKALRKHRDDLPPPLRECVIAQPGCGYWFQLPPK